MHGTDLELLRRYTEASDAEALAELVARNRDMVYAACYRVLGRRGDAEDAAQECFLQLAQSAGAVKVSVAGWLHRVAVRTALAMQRKSRARGKAEREAATLQYAEVSEGIVKALAHQVYAWSWTDDDYAPLPSPREDREAFVECLWQLEDHEIAWLQEHLTDGANISKN